MNYDLPEGKTYRVYSYDLSDNIHLEKIVSLLSLGSGGQSPLFFHLLY